MRIVLFYHSLISDWNHGNAHFLRGVVAELLERGHHVDVYEPEDGWSLQNLIRHYGKVPVDDFHRRFPLLHTNFYRLETLDLDKALENADLVIVHEWNDSELIERAGKHCLKARYNLLFHDTHHRAVTDSSRISKYPLDNFDGVLAFGEAIREIYIRSGWARRVWTWHEAADTRIFKPMADVNRTDDLVWIGNWGDEERTAELDEYIVEAVRTLGLKTRFYGVRYPAHALQLLEHAGIAYMGWISNYRVPAVLARFRATVHIPRRPYVDALPGIPTIRVFEALACGIPLVCSPWNDTEGLFRPGRDFLLARNPNEMMTYLKHLINDEDIASELAANGLATIKARHTCAHRVDELLDIVRTLRTGVAECKSLSLDLA
jgi:spore maturation protein CgeB